MRRLRSQSAHDARLARIWIMGTDPSFLWPRDGRSTRVVDTVPRQRSHIKHAKEVTALRRIDARRVSVVVSDG